MRYGLRKNYVNLHTLVVILSSDLSTPLTLALALSQLVLFVIQAGDMSYVGAEGLSARLNNS